MLTSILRFTGKFIKRLVDSIPSRDGMIGNQALSGRWVVVYRDGARSQRMFRRTARDYAQMFGGRVFHVSDLPEDRKNARLIAPAQG